LTNAYPSAERAQNELELELSAVGAGLSYGRRIGDAQTLGLGAGLGINVQLDSRGDSYSWEFIHLNVFLSHRVASFLTLEGGPRVSVMSSSYHTGDFSGNWFIGADLATCFRWKRLKVGPRFFAGGLEGGEGFVAGVFPLTVRFGWPF
jgi:hypothetical protein